MHFIHDRDDDLRDCPSHASAIASRACATENSSARDSAHGDRNRLHRAVTIAVTCCVIDASHARRRRCASIARGLKPNGSVAWCARDHA
jgi:hypothetical protein